MKSKNTHFYRLISTQLRRFFSLAVLVSVLILFPFVTHGAEVTLAWDANTEPDLAGYNIYYGTASGVYSDDPINVGSDVTEVTLTGFEDGGTYYFAATAYDEDNNESDYSEELVHTFSNGKPINSNPTTPSVPAGPTTGYIQTSYSFDTAASDPDGDSLQYRFNWGDGVISGWGAASQNHSWTSSGNFCVKAQAKDSKGALSGWSSCKNITISENTHTITATAGAKGSISPSGSVTVDHGSNRTFTITAGTNYHVQDVLVNGVSVGAVTSYTFTNVTKNHTIQASFAINKHTITATGGANGSISPSGSVTVNHGSNRTFTISADANYHVQDVLVDGTSVGAVTSYTFTNVAKNHTIQASFAINTHTITATGGANGSISPSGSVTVNHGSNRTFTVSADADYHVQDVLVDGTSVGAVTSYTFTNVTQNHTIQASFTINKHTITATAGANGSISPSGNVTVNHGSNRTFNITAGVNYHVQDVLVNGDSVGAVTSYTFATVTQDHTIQTSFAIDKHPPVADAGANQAVWVNDTVHLDGSGSSDADGDTLSFKWSFTSKPAGSSATLSNATAVNPTYVVDVAGSYIVQLIVNDGAADSQPDTVIISTENSPPAADAGANQAVWVNDTVQLDGSGSSDADGDSLTFHWSIISQPTGSKATLSNTQIEEPILLSYTEDVKPTFDVDVAGTYIIQLIVNDGTADSQPDTVIISTENSPPAADAGVDQAAWITDTVHLDGSSSSDADGDTLSFKWSFTSKPNGSSAALSDAAAVNPSFVVDVAGSYIAQLIVNDGTADSQPDTVIISTENSPPAADAGVDQAAWITDTVYLDGSSSSDADGDTLSFKWSFTSKPNGSSAALSDAAAVNPSFVVDVAGSYIAQLIVNDGTTNSQPDAVIISTENSPPKADAGDDQTVEEGDAVVLDGFNSSDPDDNITGYSWEQTDDGVKVDLTNPGEAEATFIAPSVGIEPEMLNFKLTVIDAEGLQNTATCSVLVTKAVSEDRDGDGYPDDEDAFPDDKNEHLDTDGDTVGNNADTDDDEDGMPDEWELKYGLDPLKWDADDDPDGDGVSNFDEYYYFGTDPNNNEDNFDPYPPLLIAPDDDETVSSTPLLETEEFDDPNYNDVHSWTQWEIKRAEDGYIVFDVTSDSSLTSLTVPTLILEYDTDYIWRVKFSDNHGGASDWSEDGYFTTEFSEADSDGNGIPDHQEVDDTLDLDKDGVPDREQSDIKCIVAESGNVQIGVSIRDAENVDSILSLEIEETENANLISKSKGKPRFIDFGLLHFKLLLNAPGAETVVTIHLSEAPFGKRKKLKKIKMYKYDPVNAEWLDYSKYAEFSKNRKKVYLTLKDGGFGDADGIENGIIVDPLAFGSDSDSNSSSGSDSDDSLIPDNISCFIAAASSDPGNMHPLCNWRELSIVFILMVLGYVGTEIYLRFRQKRGDEAKRMGRIAM